MYEFVHMHADALGESGVQSPHGARGTGTCKPPAMGAGTLSWVLCMNSKYIISESAVCILVC